MLSYKESLKILKEANALIEGHFILSSGLHSPQYVQCAQLMSKPDKAKKICESLSEKINNEFKEFEQIAKTKGFLLVSSSPLTRSSYHADEDFKKLQDARNKQLKCLPHQ